MRLRTLGMVAAAVLALAAPAMAQQTYALPVTHTVTLTAVFVDAADYQTAAPGAVTWTVSDATKATLTPSTDGLSATLTPIVPGAVVVTAKSGTLTQTLAVQIVGPAVALRIGISDPKPKGGS